MNKSSVFAALALSSAALSSILLPQSYASAALLSNNNGACNDWDLTVTAPTPPAPYNNSSCFGEVELSQAPNNNDVKGDGTPLLNYLNGTTTDGTTALTQSDFQDSSDYNSWLASAMYDVPGVSWDFIEKINVPETTVAGSADGDVGDPNLSITWNSDRKSGTWNVSPALTQPFALSLKGSTGFAVYFFDNSPDPTSASAGTWLTNALSNNGNQVPALSHISLFVKNGGGPTVRPPASVPEPSTVLGSVLMLGACGLLGYQKKQRSKKQIA